jgi:hypothetical protein
VQGRYNTNRWKKNPLLISQLIIYVFFINQSINKKEIPIYEDIIIQDQTSHIYYFILFIIRLTYDK